MFDVAWRGWLTLSISVLVLGAVVAGFLWMDEHPQAVVAALGIAGAIALYCAIMVAFAWGTDKWRIWGIYEAIAFYGRLLGALTLILVGWRELGVWVFGLGAAVELLILWRALREHWQARVLCVCLVAGGNALLTAALLHATGRGDLGLVLVGIVGMLAGMFGGAVLGVHLLAGSSPIFGIARTTMIEAVRSRIGIVIIAVLVVFVATRLQATADDRLDYELTRSLTWSMAAVGILLGAMTLILSCLSICRDLEARVAHLTFTKPVSRLHYLVGKWLGLMTLNTVMIMVSGLAIYLMCMTVLAREPVDSPERIRAVQEVLTARAERLPRPESPAVIDSHVQRQIEQWERENLDAEGRPRIARDDPRLIDEFRGAAVSAWHTIEPLQRRTYIFEGLDVGRAAGQPIFLRLKPERARAMEIGDRDSVFIQIFLDGHLLVTEDMRDVEGALLPGMEMKDRAFREIAIPPQFIDEDGRLEVGIRNPSPRTGPQSFGSLSFRPGTDLQILISVGGFEANLVRGMIVIWLQLGLVAIMGLLAGSFLSFQVAMLFASVLTLGGLARDYVLQSLRYYVSFPRQGDDLGSWLMGYGPAVIQSISEGEMDKFAKLLVALLGRLVAELTPSIAAYSPIGMIATGRYLPWLTVLEAGLWLWVIWGLLLGLIAWWLFSRREIAQITV